MAGSYNVNGDILSQGINCVVRIDTDDESGGNYRYQPEDEYDGLGPDDYDAELEFPAETAQTGRDSVNIGENERLKYKGHFVFPESNIRYLDESELYGLSDWELYVGRNEIFAWYGRGFVDEYLHEYFTDQDWYTERYSREEFEALPEQLNEYEKANAKLILNYEREIDSKYLK